MRLVAYEWAGLTSKAQARPRVAGKFGRYIGETGSLYLCQTVARALARVAVWHKQSRASFTYVPAEFSSHEQWPSVRYSST